MNGWSDITRATNAQILAWAEPQPWLRAMAGCQQDAQWHAKGDQKRPLFPGELQDSLANRRRDPKLGFLFQLVEQRAHVWDQSRNLGLLGGVVALQGTAEARTSGDWSGSLYRELRTSPANPVQLRLVPYYAWGNRGKGEMTVWMPRAR
jgi:hypothetical protein